MSADRLAELDACIAEAERVMRESPVVGMRWAQLVNDLKIERDKLAYQAREVLPGEPCPLSIGHPYARDAKAGYHRVGGDRCCTFCGSWHADEFEAWCRRILSGEEPAAFGVKPGVGELMGFPALTLNDHRNKLYVRRPGITNAGDGAIKVKCVHLTDAQIYLANETLRFCREKAAAIGGAA